MLLNKSGHTPVERCDSSYKLGTGIRIRAKWKNYINTYRTCGEFAHEIECLVVHPKSLELLQLGLEKDIDLETIQANPKNEPLNFSSNCHGFTFVGGSCIIENHWVPSILDDEFHEVSTADKADVVCFRHVTTGEWIYSSKYTHGLYIHKNGIREYSAVKSVDAVLGANQSQNIQIHYFKRTREMCEGICNRTLF